MNGLFEKIYFFKVSKGGGQHFPGGGMVQYFPGGRGVQLFPGGSKC